MKKFSQDECYRFIFENSMDAILLTCPDGRIFRANPAACALFQMSEEEICKAGRLGIVDMKDPRLLQALKERSVNNKVRSELNFVKKNKEVFPADVTSSVFMDNEGRKWTTMIIRDISSDKELEDKVKSFAYIDYLTEIFNRRALIEQLQAEIARTARENTSLSLLMVDIDHFKEINDKFGHSCGDIVLQKFAKCLANNIRQYDKVGRYGGDEFIICLPNTSYEKAHEIAERLRKTIEEYEVECNKEKIKITASIGLVTYDINLDENLDSLISKVDNCMYFAKQKRNTVYG